MTAEALADTRVVVMNGARPPDLSPMGDRIMTSSPQPAEGSEPGVTAEA